MKLSEAFKHLEEKENEYDFSEAIAFAEWVWSENFPRPAKEKEK